MRGFALLFVAFVCVSNISFGQTQLPKKTPSGRGYLEYLPASYAGSSELYPCIIFLHGSGERGDGSPAALEKVKSQGIPKVIKNGGTMCFDVNGKTECFIVLSPQQTTNRSGWNGDVIPFIQFALGAYRIDPSRVYVTGLSMGGDGTWDASYTSGNNPNYIAAIAPVSGEGDYKGAKNTAGKKIFVWAHHGDKDTAVPLADGQRPINGMNSVNADPAPIFTIYAGMGHSGSLWDKVYAPNHNTHNPNLYEWFLTKKLSTTTPPANVAPVANAGSDQSYTLPANAAFLTGSGTDSDGTISSYAWSQVSGPSTATLSGQNTATLNISACVQGVYTFSLTVTDDKGATASDNVSVEFLKANTAPTANAGIDQAITLPTNSTTITGSGTDSDGTISTYAWSQLSGPSAATTSGQNTASLNISACVQGTYAFALTVTDNQGATATDNVSVEFVSSANTPPVVNAGSDFTILLPIMTGSITADASDTGGTIVSYVWTKTWGPAATLTNANASTLTFVGSATGTYTFSVTVTDNSGQSATDEIKVTIKKAPPVANAGVDKQVVQPASTTTLDGVGTDADGTITGYAWKQTSGPAAVIADPTQAVAQVSGLTAVGQYVFMLTVTDNDNQKTSDYVKVVVSKATTTTQTTTARTASPEQVAVAETSTETFETKTELAQNYPNPFRDTTTIPFSLDKSQHVVLKVYDYSGIEVQTLVNGELEAGEHNIEFAPRDPGKLYIIKLFASGKAQTMKALRI